MDITPSTAQTQEENSDPPHSETRESRVGSPIDPSWEKWRNEQIQTISSILSSVFRAEDEAHQIQAPSRLLRNPARQSGGDKKELCEKLSAIRQQISEYEQVLQLSLKRIDNALQEIHPQTPEVIETPAPVKQLTKFESFKNWVKKILR
jgi:hypothetical protein